VRLARFTADGMSRFGVVLGDEVVAVDGRVPSFEALVADPPRGVPHPDDRRWPAVEVGWLPPFVSRAKIVCVGFNYRDYVGEAVRAATHRPTLFVRWTDTFVGSGHPVVRPSDAPALDWEGEVALVIGRPTRRVPVERAGAHIAGMTCMAENTEREWQQHSGQATAGKNWVASGACGPWITTTDNVPSGPLRLTTRLNGEVVQDATTDQLTHSFPELVSYVSTFTELRPGDVIATGTPAGIGHRRTPPRYLRPGDELSVSVAGVGVLTHGVVDEPLPATEPARAATTPAAHDPTEEYAQ
jgi:2-keto-4-pentenoate hydratase/2-oxohepta-3-ene-1,7-dioic acid hydratase in catechol pathway